MNDQVKEYLSKNGKKGGNTTKERHPEHFKRISQLGVEARRRRLALMKTP